MSWKELQANIEKNRIRREDIKAQARQIIKRDWLGNLGLLVMPFVTFGLGLFILGLIIGGIGLVKTIAGLVGVVILFLIGLFVISLWVNYGIQVMQYRGLVQVRESDEKARPFWGYFKQFLNRNWLKRTLVVSFFTGLFVILWGIIPYVTNYGVGVLSGLAVITGSMGADSSGLIGWAMLLHVVSWVTLALLIYKMLGYAFGPYLMFDADRRDRQLGGPTMLKMGLSLVKGHRFEILTMLLSFFWWYFLVVIVEWILFVYVNDYVAVIAFMVMWLYIGSYLNLTWAGYYEALRVKKAEV